VHCVTGALCFRCRGRRKRSVDYLVDAESQIPEVPKVVKELERHDGFLSSSAGVVDEARPLLLRALATTILRHRQSANDERRWTLSITANMWEGWEGRRGILHCSGSNYGAKEPFNFNDSSRKLFMDIPQWMDQFRLNSDFKKAVAAADDLPEYRSQSNLERGSLYSQRTHSLNVIALVQCQQR